MPVISGLKRGATKADQILENIALVALALALAMALPRHRPALPGCLSLRLRTRMKRMPLYRARDTRSRPANPGVGMNVLSAVRPGSAPAGIVQEYTMPAPVEADPARRPAPRREESADAHAEAEADRAAHREPYAWGEEHDPRIVKGDHDKGRIDRHDRDVRSAAYDDLAVGPQVAVALGGGPLPLYRVHDVLLLGQERVSNLGGPVHVSIHHVQHGGKREQRLHAGIPWQLISSNGVGQRLPGKVMMLIRPLGGRWNGVGVGGRRQDLRQQRVWIK